MAPVVFAIDPYADRYAGKRQMTNPRAIALHQALATLRTLDILATEAQVLRWSDGSNGATVTFALPGDETHLFKGKSHGKHGERGHLVWVPIDDNEEPAPAPSNTSFAEPKTPNPERSEAARKHYASLNEMGKAGTRAVMLCKDRRFQEWIAATDEAAAAGFLKTRLGINTRSKISTDYEVYERYIEVERRYMQDAGLLTEERR